MRTVWPVDMLSRIASSSCRACLSSSRWNRIEVCRIRSTRSNTSEPSWSRTVSPRIRPSSRMSFRSRASSSIASASSARLDRSSASEGMIWGDMVKCSRIARRLFESQFFAVRARPRANCAGALNPAPGPLPVGITQAPLEYLAGILARQLLLYLDVLGDFVISQRSLEVLADLGNLERYPGLRFHHRHQGLPEFIIGNAEDSAIVHTGNGVQRRLDLRRIDVDPARDHHIALAVAYKDVTILVDIADVA